MADANIVSYDDTSRNIDYSDGNWYSLTVSNAYNGTIKGNDKSGAFFLTFYGELPHNLRTVYNIRLTCIYIGSRISVYGSLRGMKSTLLTPTESSYSIDGVVKKTYTATQGTEDTNNVLFFDSGDIPSTPTGTHNILVNVISATPNLPYYLDYITVVSPTNSTSAALSQIPMISTTSDMPSQSAASALRLNSTSSHAVVTIAGGTICGVVILLGLIACGFLWRRRWNSRLGAGRMDADSKWFYIF